MRPGRDADPSPLLVPRSKNRIELYLYSPCGRSWPIKRVKPTYIEPLSGLYQEMLNTIVWYKITRYRQALQMYNFVNERCKVSQVAFDHIFYVLILI
jgi:hypothetical protein